MISIQQMQYIVTLSEVLHFQKASEICFVTQPTLSMQIKKAESQLGQVLFDRSKTPLELTDFGKSMLPVFRDTLNEYERVEETVKRLDGNIKEEVRVAVIPTVANYFVPDLFAFWKEELNNVRLSIEELPTEKLLSAMESGKIDIGIMAGPITNSKYRVSRLYLEEIVAYCPSRTSSTITLDEIKAETPWLLSEGNCLRTQMIHFCQLSGNKEEREWNYEGGNIPLLELMVEKHGGYTLVPANYIKDKRSDYKRIVSGSGEFPVREIVAITSNRTLKWHLLEQIIRMGQLTYNSSSDNDKYQLLNWK